MLRLFRSAKLRYLLIGIAAFVLGSATIGAAAASSDLGSLFYTTIRNGQPTQPCVTETTGQGSSTVCNAIVDSNGNLHVASQGHTSVTGTVDVGNFPTTQLVSGAVNVSNFPTTQDVNIVGGSTSTIPVAERGFHFFDNVAALVPTVHAVHVKVAYAQLSFFSGAGCGGGGSFRFFFPNGEFATYGPDSLTFPIPIDVAQIEFDNNSSGSCFMAAQLIGY